MKSEEFIIKEWAKQLLNITATVPVEQQEEKIRLCGKNLLNRIHQNKWEGKQSASIGKVSIPKSLKRAADYYNNPEREQYIRQMKKRYLNQLAYTDAIAPWYTCTMRFLPGLRAKVMECILSTFHKGITPKETARRCWKPQNTIGTIFHKIKKAGLIESRPNPKDKRSSIYFVPDEDWLRVYALRWYRGGMWWGENIPNEPEENVVDRYITWYEEHNMYAKFS